jgi:chromosome segregation ATPase
MKEELTSAKVAAEQAKSTWEKLRKERDYHKMHQNRVNDEKVSINENIKKTKNMHEEIEERLEEIQKKLQVTLKEKALLKLERDKMQNKARDLQDQIKADETKI